MEVKIPYPVLLLLIIFSLFGVGYVQGQSMDFEHQPDAAHEISFFPNTTWTTLNSYSTQITKYVALDLRRADLTVRQLSIDGQNSVTVSGFKNYAQIKAFAAKIKKDHPPFILENQTDRWFIFHQHNRNVLLRNHDWSAFAKWHHDHYLSE